MNKRVLFVSHKKSQCGVYEFGKSIINVLQHSKRYRFIGVECSSSAQLQAAIAENAPDAIIYNYYPSVLEGVATRLVPKFYRSDITSIPVPQIGIIHEITQHIADTAVGHRTKFLSTLTTHLNNSLFDHYIAPDPTLLLRNPLVYKTGRLIPSYQNNFPLPAKPVIGSFGFSTSNKGFDKVVQLVQQEFDEAVIRFNIPYADLGGDKDGTSARDIAQKCKGLITKPGIQLIVTHDFWDHKTLLDFLAQNTINIFLYEDVRSSSRGLSSTLDHAMAVQRPVAISDDPMFRHLFDVEPSVSISKNNLRTIIQNGFDPLKKHCLEWDADNLLWDYERILDSIFERQKVRSTPKKDIFRAMRSKWNRLLSLPDKGFSWLSVLETLKDDDLTVDMSVRYQPIQIPAGASLNRILDNKARELYSPAIDKLKELVPKTMSKKIPRANVQQAFVFDTVLRHMDQYKKPKILCVGSYQDTASMSLIKMGYMVEEIDPVINYTLEEYFTKPTVVKGSYDIIFSISVIEHDLNDEQFIKCIAGLLAPGGTAVITCDYKDGWKQGEPKPDCNFRFYTQRDLRDRLLPLMDNCRLVDEPQWDCPHPDFNYLGKYQYTFAAFVARKDTCLK